jgi:multiple sugar transport system permease protein
LSNSFGVQTVALLQKDEDERFIVAPVNAAGIIDPNRKQIVTQKQLHHIIEFKAHWENYLDVFKALDWKRHLLNSILYGLFGALQAILFGGLIAFILQFLIRPIFPKISNLIFLLFILTIFISPQTYLMGAFPLIHKSGLIDTAAGVTWQYSCSVSVLLLFYLYFEGQKTLASRAFPTDKTGYWRSILRGIPTLLFGICTIFMLAGMSSFLWELIITNSMKMKNAMVAMASFQGLYTTHWGFLCAAATTIWSFSLLVFTPLFILLEFTFFRKLIILKSEGETHV